MTTKKATGKRKTTAAASEEQAADVRTVRYVVNRPYSAGEAPDIVTARVKKEHEDDAEVLDLVIIEPGHGGEPTVKGVRRSDGREVGTWFEIEPEKVSD
jgi:hypothetical protein